MPPKTLNDYIISVNEIRNLLLTIPITKSETQLPDRPCYESSPTQTSKAHHINTSSPQTANTPPQTENKPHKMKTQIYKTLSLMKRHLNFVLTHPCPRLPHISPQILNRHHMVSISLEIIPKIKHGT